MLHLMKPRMSTFSTPLRLFARTAALMLLSTVAYAQAPLCHSIFQTESLTRVMTEVQSQLDPKVYEQVLLQVDQALRLLEPLPADYSVVLKSHYGQGSKNIFGAKRVEFTAVHTSYQKYTGKEDLRIIFPILAHEYSHAYFEGSMRKLSKEWNQNSSFLDYPTGDMYLKQDIASIINVYHEFFADLVPSIIFKDSGAMQSALRFHDGGSSSDASSITLRKFEGYKPELHEAKLKEIFKSGSGATAYLFLVPLRNEIWPVIQSKLVEYPNKQDQVFKEIVITLAKDYEARVKTKNFSFSKMNIELANSLIEAIQSIH